MALPGTNNRMAGFRTVTYLSIILPSFPHKADPTCLHLLSLNYFLEKVSSKARRGTIPRTSEEKIFFLSFLFSYFDTGSHATAQAGLELTM